MTEISKVTFTLTLDTVMTNKLLKSMKHAGFSRVPVVEGDSKVVGILLAKSCLGVDLHEEKTLRQLSRERQIDIRIPLYLP
jgi:CBS domain containing-hemolysin-like protein